VIEPLRAHDVIYRGLSRAEYAHFERTGRIKLDEDATYWTTVPHPEDYAYVIATVRTADMLDLHGEVGVIRAIGRDEIVGLWSCYRGDWTREPNHWLPEEKFDESQHPRDEHGRWTDAGTDGGASAADEGGKSFLVSGRPNKEKLDLWKAQIAEQKAQLKAEGQEGSAKDDELYRMDRALAEYSITPAADLDAKRVALETVYDTDIKLQATALSSFNADKKVATVEIVGSLDQDARIKALQMTIGNYAGLAKRIEAQEWSDDTASIEAYEKAGFRRAGTSSVGGVRLIYGADEPTAEELQVLEAQRKDQRKLIEARARETAKQLDFDPKSVIVSDEKREFTLNGRVYNYAGSYRHGTTEVKLYPANLTVATTAGVTAHEIAHRKLDALRATYRDQYSDMIKEPGPPPNPEHPYYWGKRGGRDAVMAPDGTLHPPFDKKYPVYNEWTKITMDFGQMITDDGVSPYSVDWWKAWKDTTAGIDNAFHETIAEIARLDQETGKPPGSQQWRDLYKLINDHWTQMTPLERQAKRPLNEPWW